MNTETLVKELSVCSVEGNLYAHSPDCPRCLILNNEEFLLNKYGDRKYKQNWFLYILLLTGFNWYVGISNKIRSRIYKHFTNRGSEWTKKHSPIAVHKILHFPLEYPQTHMEDIEDLATLRYMNLYGKENVRGGSFCTRYELTDFDLFRIRQRRSQLSVPARE